jgi:hypothetical protein
MAGCSKLFVLPCSILLIKATDVDIKQSYLSIHAISEECPTFEEISDNPLDKIGILKLAVAGIDHWKDVISTAFDNVAPLALHFSVEGGALFIDLHGQVRIHYCAHKSMCGDPPEWTFPFGTWDNILDLNNPVNTSAR